MCQKQTCFSRLLPMSEVVVGYKDEFCCNISALSEMPPTGNLITCSAVTAPNDKFLNTPFTTLELTSQIIAMLPAPWV